MIRITWQNGRNGPIFTEAYTLNQARAFIGLHGTPYTLVAVEYDSTACRNVAADRDWLDRMAEGIADDEGYDYDSDPHWNY